MTDEEFKWNATRKSREELRDTVDEREKYLPESVEAAVTELQNRGEEFSDEELRMISEDMQARRAMANSAPGYGLFNNADKFKQVEDPDAPAFYSRKAIYAFSILFSVLFGAILFAFNVSKTPKRGNVIWVILYGIAFSTFTVIISENYHLNTGFAIVAGIIGAYPLNYFFWTKFIGNDTLYRVRPVWCP